MTLQYQHERKERDTKYIGPRPSFPKLKREAWPMMRQYLRARDLSASLAKDNGWYPTYYIDSNRIVIPCTNSDGIPYFQARDMRGKSKIRYASPAASRDDSIVIVWPEDFKHGGIIVEGPMDALAAAEFGFVGVALMGNVPTPEVVNHLVTMTRAFTPIYIIPDVDTPALGPTVLSALAQRGIATCITMLPPDEKDLAELPYNERKRFLCAIS